MVCVTRTGQRSYDYQATGGQHGQTFANKVTKATLDHVPGDSASDSLADNETRTRRGGTSPRRVRVPCLTFGAQVNDQKRSSGPASSTYRAREVLPPPQPILGGQHGITPRASVRSGGQTGAALATAGRE